MTTFEKSYPLSALSWQQLGFALKAMNSMLQDFQIIKNKCIGLNLSIGEFERYYGEHIARVNRNIDNVNAEINRRNNLIGVI